MNVDRTRDFERFNENEDDVRFRKKEKAPKTVSVQNEHQQTVISSANGAKVLKSIDDAIVKYEKEEKTKEKTFLGNLSKILNASQHGSNSQYATFEAVNGKVFTIRLANHNAKISNFDNHNESEGISIVITPKENLGVENDGNAHVVEYFYDAIKLRKADGKPLVEILKSIKQALYSGEYVDNTSIAEREEVNADDYYNRFINDNTEALISQRRDMVHRIQSLAEKLNIRNLEIVTDTCALEGNSKNQKVSSQREPER